jgi:type IV secretory pathway TraG/TraD family ATPase VirD4
MTKATLDATTSRDDAILLAGGLAVLTISAGVGYTSLHLAARIDGNPPPPTGFLDLITALTEREVAWGRTATLVALGVAVPLYLMVLGVLLLVDGRRRGRAAVDDAAAHMATARDLQPLTGRAQLAKAKRLGARTTEPGFPIGHALLPPRGRRKLPIYGSWEDNAVLVAGPRTNKTTAYAVPIILAAPGLAIVTSNKPDVVWATSRIRADKGRVWVFDPQHVAGHPQTWWWDPLTYVAPVDPPTGCRRPDETRAEKLAAQFAMSSRPAGAKRDAYFDGEGEALVGLLLLAAACGGNDLTDVYRWLTNPLDDNPGHLLATAGFELQRAALASLAHLPDKQREGVYGTARAVMGFVRTRDVARWCTPTAGVPALDVADLATSTDTLYLLSKEGHGSAGPIVAALTVAVTEALEARAGRSPAARLPVPAVVVLDEAANICRIRHLDSLYSHYGSRGIVMVTILQNWAQGAEVWGPLGIEKLWSAANVAIYGGGVADDRYLKRLSDLAGQHEQVLRTESWQRGKRTRTRSIGRDTILPVSMLRELPAGRAVVWVSGTRATLIEPQPWFRAHPLRNQIAEAVAVHEAPAPAPTPGGASAGE